MDNTLYDVLHVSKGADLDIIDAAYERLCQKHQDDEVILKSLKMAHETLRDPVRRAKYDQRFNVPPAPSYTDYRRDVGASAPGWWRSPKFAGIVVVMVGIGMYLNYAKHDKEVRVVREVTKNDARSVDTERVLVDRSMDNQDRRTEISKEALDRSVELARLEQQRRAAITEASIAQQNERLRMQREQQEYATEQRRIAQQRMADDRARYLAQQQLERDRRALCQMEIQRYGRAISC